MFCAIYTNINNITLDLIIKLCYNFFNIKIAHIEKKKGIKINMANPNIKSQNELHATPLNSFEYPFWVCQYGHNFADLPSHEIRIKSDVSCLQYVVAGSGVIITGNHSHHVQQGDTFLLLEGQDQNYYGDTANSFEKIWFNFKGILGLELIKIYHLENAVLFKNLCSEPLITEMHHLCQTISDPKKLQDATSRHFLKIVQFLAENNVKSQSNQDMTDLVRYYIDCHITENLKLADIEAFTHFSQKHIIELFKGKYGITPHQYILRCKMKIASSLLISTNKTIEAISDSLSFSDPHHFSAQFKKYSGLRPKDFRSIEQKKTLTYKMAHEAQK